jgi:hypothetical protein
LLLPPNRRPLEKMVVLSTALDREVGRREKGWLVPLMLLTESCLDLGVALVGARQVDGDLLLPSRTKVSR